MVLTMGRLLGAKKAYVHWQFFKRGKEFTVLYSVTGTKKKPSANFTNVISLAIVSSIIAMGLAIFGYFTDIYDVLGMLSIIILILMFAAFIILTFKRSVGHKLYLLLKFGWKEKLANEIAETQREKILKEFGLFLAQHVSRFGWDNIESILVERNKIKMGYLTGDGVKVMSYEEEKKK